MLGHPVSLTLVPVSLPPLVWVLEPGGNLPVRWPHRLIAPNLDLQKISCRLRKVQQVAVFASLLLRRCCD